MWSGRITPEKGTHLAIAAARLAGSTWTSRGRSATPATLMERSRHTSTTRIRYLGHLPHKQLVEVVGAARACLVTPCWDEPFGLVVAEALSCGTPIVGFRAGALPELTDLRCAHLVAPGDVAALADAIAHVGLLSRSHARSKAVRLWSSDAMVDCYEAFYTELLDADRVPA